MPITAVFGSSQGCSKIPRVDTLADDTEAGGVSIFCWPVIDLDVSWLKVTIVMSTASPRWIVVA